MIDIGIFLIGRVRIQQSHPVGLEVEFQDSLIDRIFIQNTLVIGTVHLVQYKTILFVAVETGGLLGGIHHVAVPVFKKAEAIYWITGRADRIGILHFFQDRQQILQGFQAW